MFLSSPIVQELVHKHFFFFVWAWLVYQTSLKLKLEFGLFIKKNEYERAFYQAEPELFMNSLVCLQPYLQFT